jgi:hypothetical protein
MTTYIAQAPRLANAVMAMTWAALCAAETRQGYEAQAEDNRAEASHQALDAEGAADAVHGGLTAEEVRGRASGSGQQSGHQQLCLHAALCPCVGAASVDAALYIWRHS